MHITSICHFMLKRNTKAIVGFATIWGTCDTNNNRRTTFVSYKVNKHWALHMQTVQGILTIHQRLNGFRCRHHYNHPRTIIGQEQLFNDKTLFMTWKVWSTNVYLYNRTLNWLPWLCSRIVCIIETSFYAWLMAIKNRALDGVCFWYENYTSYSTS